MLSQSTTVAAALLADNTVKGIVSTRVYQDEPPITAVFPCVVFAESVLSIAFEDNVESGYRNTFDVETYVKANAWTLATAVKACMLGLGYICRSAQSAGMVGDGTIHQVSLQFINVKEA